MFVRVYSMVHNYLQVRYVCDSSLTAGGYTTVMLVAARSLREQNHE